MNIFGLKSSRKHQIMTGETIIKKKSCRLSLPSRRRHDGAFPSAEDSPLRLNHKRAPVISNFKAFKPKPWRGSCLSILRKINPENADDYSRYTIPDDDDDDSHIPLLTDMTREYPFGP
jgi:hypothetical protein